MVTVFFCTDWIYFFCPMVLATSREQMKMFLTRMGFGSKVVITGDVTQIDLPADKTSGLKEAVRVLKNVEGIGICELTDPMVTVFFCTDWTYFFCPMVLAFTGRPLEVMQITSAVSSAALSACPARALVTLSAECQEQIGRFIQSP